MHFLQLINLKGCDKLCLIKDKKDLEKIILCDVPDKIYPEIEKTFLNLVHNSGHPEIKLEKKVDFHKLYKERFN